MLARALLVGFLLGCCISTAAAQTFEEVRTRAMDVLHSMKLEPKVVRSKHFHILYVGDRRFAELRRENLELTYRNLRVFVQNKMRMKVDLKHEPLLVVLLDDQNQMLDFGRRTGVPLSQGVAGFYVPAHNWSVFFNQRNSPSVESIKAEARNLERLLARYSDAQLIPWRGPDGRVQRVSKARLRNDLKELLLQERAAMETFNIVVTQHEGAHHIAHNIGVQQRGAEYPFWVSEGLASLFETPPRKRGASIQGAGKTNRDRLKTYKSLVKKGQNLGLHRLITNPEGAQAAVDVDAAYAESWATFEFLFRRHSTKLRNYMNLLAERSEQEQQKSPGSARLRARSSQRGREELQLFQEVFGSVDELQDDMDKYLERLR